MRQLPQASHGELDQFIITHLPFFHRVMALKVGRMIQEYQPQDHDDASDWGLSTAVDKETEKFLRMFIHLLNRSSIIIAEEEYPAGKNQKLLDAFMRAPFAYVGDPMDGTNAKVNGLPFYCYASSFLRSGRPFHTSIYAPEDRLGDHKGLFFEANSNGSRNYPQGAFMNGIRISPSAVHGFRNARIMVYTPNGIQEDPWIATLRDRASSIDGVQKGAGNLIMAKLAAAGSIPELETYWHAKIKFDGALWDVYPGAHLLDVAGGQATLANGRSIVNALSQKMISPGRRGHDLDKKKPYLRGPVILSPNPVFHRQILDMISQN